MRSIAYLAAFAALAHGTYVESLSGLGLLGDHAGIPSLNATFDYVVVGGGTAGIALATRLAENGTFSVALVEAGSFYEFLNGNLTTVPGTAGYFIGTDPVLFNPAIDWGYRCEPDAGLGGRSILYNSGKSLGGGSSRNYMVYDRGTTGSYQLWADTVGDQSYALQNFQAYFRKSASFSPPPVSPEARNGSSSIAALDPAVIGSDGPLQVSFFAWVNAVGTWAALAMQELGLKQLPNLVSGNLMGFARPTVTVAGSTQTRSSAETSYLRQAFERTTTLALYSSTLAQKIVFRQGSSGAQASGVVVTTAGAQYVLSARREVILSAGAHRSPQLLMVSGIGPQAVLNELQIPIVSQLEGVGQNMWDQPFFGPSWAVGLTTHSALTYDPAFAAEQIAAYQTNRTGMFTNTGSDFIAWENLPADLQSTLQPATVSGLKTFPSDWPQVQYTFADAYSGYGRDAIVGAPTDGRNYISILPALVATFSRGNVTIRSTDTSVNPVISPNLLNDPRDQDVAIAAYKRARQMANTTAFQKIIVGPEAFPGANVTTDEEILNIIMQSATPIWHASGTNKMGMANDTMAVLDSQARVRGVQGLRVVDASAFPFLIPAHPSGTVYALAEKIAEDILNPS